jgi:ATP-dependent RNA helicase HelY
LRSDRAALTARFAFEPDRFQLAAFDALDDGYHVVVSAPTGSGKTAVAEYGIAAALADGRRAFYTAPLKALSNQKFRDLMADHGVERVGLLTGDNSVRPDAPVVVMTTEVLRNMIYAGSEALDDLALVVLDEVHFLQDAYRGPVWEEVIIHLPPEVQLVCLSATVSNADELAEWMSTVRGLTRTVTEGRRPVELLDHYLVADRSNDRLQLMPTFVDGSVNRDAVRLDESRQRGPMRNRRGRPTGASGRRLATPDRIETVTHLGVLDMLPCIVFIFSRAQCEAAAQSCLDAGLVLTDPDEAAEIDRILEERIGSLDDADLEALGIQNLRAQMTAGFAPHHAGMVPPFKEAVEICFTRGLIRAVFATETLAVGVNMPARTVVIEKTTKFNGDHHVSLSPAEFTQLTGRAGRRGIDTIGNAVVLWSPWVRYQQVAELASSRTFGLRSVFRPTYNMTANLVRRHTRERARELLLMSFAQFQGDREVVRSQGRLTRRREQLASAEQRAASPFGDIEEYRLLNSRESRSDRTPSLRPGDVIDIRVKGYRGQVAVVATAHRSDGLRVSAVTPAGRPLTLSAADLAQVTGLVGRIAVPEGQSPNRKDVRREVARRLRRAELPSSRAPRPSPDRHPVEDDPDLRDRLRAAGEADRLRSELRRLEERVDDRRSSLGREFDSVTSVLSELGHIRTDSWALTDSGELLASIFHESDLLVTEALRRGMFDGLDSVQLAALASCFVYEHRSPDDPPPPAFPDRVLRERWQRLEALSEEIAKVEERHERSRHRPPDPGFMAAAAEWAAGIELSEVLEDDLLTGGDFVRNIRQVIDLTQQIADVSPDTDTAATASGAVDACLRGVISDSAAIGEAS